MVERQRLGFLSEPEGSGSAALERPWPATRAFASERWTLASGSLTVGKPLPASAEAGLLSPASAEAGLLSPARPRPMAGA
jgi:hypothetical protein